jgi:hypothetical protein
MPAIGTFETSCDVRFVVANGWEADMARQPNSVENDTTLTSPGVRLCAAVGGEAVYASN